MNDEQPVVRVTLDRHDGAYSATITWPRLPDYAPAYCSAPSLAAVCDRLSEILLAGPDL